jgi:5-methyltetrahydrofolate--homocysteine methyltransferase
MAMRKCAGNDDILIAKGNCGIPEFVGGEICYSGTPELMAEYACLARDLNVRIIGGCCGTTPDHLRVMREALETRELRPEPSLDHVVSLLGPVTAGTRMCCEEDFNTLLEQNQPHRERRRSN